MLSKACVEFRPCTVGNPPAGHGVNLAAAAPAFVVGSCALLGVATAALALASRRAKKAFASFTSSADSFALAFAFAFCSSTGGGGVRVGDRL